MKDMDNVFTNKEELEYPLETDLVNIKVLNNNTRLLDEKKADISDIEVSLQGVAKERSEYSIENKVKEIENKLILLEEKEKLKNWTLLPNLKSNAVGINNSGSRALVEVSGKGHLVYCVFGNLVNGTAGSQSYKVEIDGKVIFDTKVNFSNTYIDRHPKVSHVGIVNTCVYTYLDSVFKNALLIPILQTNGVPYKICLTAPKEAIKPLGTNKHTVSNNSYRIGNYSTDNEFYVPLQVRLDEPLRFEKSLKITYYDTQGLTTSGNTLACNYVYNLDE